MTVDQISGDANGREKTTPPRIYMDATLKPHRSLSPAGFTLVMAAVAIGGFSIGLAFFVAGAWPVAGFCGLEIALLYFAFKMNYRSGKVQEHIQLSDDGLHITKVKPNGKVSRVRLEPSWLNVMMDDPPSHESQLVVATRGKGMILGAFLTPGERLEVADALRQALRDYRAPEHLKA